MFSNSEVERIGLAQISISLAKLSWNFLRENMFSQCHFCLKKFITRNLPVFQTQNSKKKSWLPRFLPKNQAAHHVMSHQLALYGKMHAIICNIPFNHMHT
jgi:hypothetical protein